MKFRSKVKILAIILSVLIDFTLCVTYLRPKNDRGPGKTCLKCVTLQTIVTKTFIHFEGAASAGVDCIEQVERYFFKNQLSTQVQNLAVFHSKNMTSPAMEIEVQYLFGLNDRILHIEKEEERFQLKVISSVDKKFSINHMSLKDVILTDLYVIVGDNLNIVRTFGNQLI
jgi:hypothetical protein